MVLKVWLPLVSHLSVAWDILLQILPLLSELRAGNLVGNVEALTQVGRGERHWPTCNRGMLAMQLLSARPSTWPGAFGVHLLFPTLQAGVIIALSACVNCAGPILQVAAEAAADIQRLQTEVRVVLEGQNTCCPAHTQAKKGPTVFVRPHGCSRTVSAIHLRCLSCAAGADGEQCEGAARECADTD